MRSLVFVLALAPSLLAQDPRYTRRVSDCARSATGRPTRPLPAAPIRADGYTASRTITLTPWRSATNGGAIRACSEYGRIEVEDSDDGMVHVQVRVEGYGEGAPDPAAAAHRVIEETLVRVSATEDNGRLLLDIWTDTLSFTPAAQPGFVSIRVQLPERGVYEVSADGYHGAMSIRRLTLGRSVLRGRVGDKFKGIPGYIGYVELDQVAIAGDVSVSSDGAALSPPVYAKVRPAAGGSLAVTNGGDVQIAVVPHPELGVRGIAAANSGSARVLIDAAAARDTTLASYRSAAVAESPRFSELSRRFEVRALSSHGSANIAAMPSAPLRR